MPKKNKTSPKVAKNLEQVEKRYNAFFNSSEDGIWCFEAAAPIPIDLPQSKIVERIFRHGILVECNTRFARMHSAEKPEDLTGIPLHQFLDSTIPQNVSIIKSFVQNNFRLTNIEYHRKSDTEPEKIFIINLFGVIEDNHLVQTWGVQRDITEQMNAQEKLKKSEDRYRNIFDYAFDAIFIETLDGDILATNKQAGDMLGYSKDEFLTMNIRQLIPESLHKNLPDLNEKIKENGIAVVRSKNRHKDGHDIDVEICVKTFTEDNRELAQVFVRDISEQIQSHETIQSLSAQIEQFSRISADIITITDQEELFQRISDAIVEISDFSRVLFYTFKNTAPYRNILGHVGISDKNLVRIQNADAHKEKYLDLFQKGIQLGNQSCYIPHTMKHLVLQHAVDYGKKSYASDAGWHREDNLLVALKNKSGDIVGMISLDDSKSGKKPTDATVKPIELFANHISQVLKLKELEEEQREIEQRFQQSEKLRALGEMAGGVAHDFNNVLSAILGRAQLLKRDVTDPEILHGLEIIEKAAIDGAATIKRIQEFTRLRTDRQFDRIDINEAIRDSIKYTKTRWETDANEKDITYDIQTDFENDILVTANSSEMREVFTNLILNAVEAMPGGGKIRIATQAGDNTLTATVRDNGPGMDNDTKKRAFDPFFTTRGVEGTGLGLSVTYGIVRRHGGDIVIDSDIGKGTTVTIKLPLDQNEPVTHSDAEIKEPSDGIKPSGKILVVDDEEDPRELLQDILEMYGYTVITADSGKNALSALDNDEDINIIFTDLGMPQMSGWEVSKTIKSRRPAAVIVVITGWGTQLDPDRLKDCGIEKVIAKPFQVDQIKALVADCTEKLRNRNESNQNNGS